MSSGDPKRKAKHPATRSIASKTWKFVVAFGVVVGILSGVPSIRQEVKSWFRQITVELAWYEVDAQGNRNIIPLNSVNIMIDENDLIRRRVNIPINLAVRNRNKEPLEIVSMEFTYDKSLDIRSEAKRKIPRQPGRIVFEHDLGVLPVSDSFTPLPTIDVVSFPTFFAVEEIVIIMADGIPNYTVAVLGLHVQEKQGVVTPVTINFGCVINAKAYAPIKGRINLVFKPISVGIVWPSSAESKSSPIREGSSILKLDEWRKGVLLNEWDGVYKDSRVAQSRIRYVKRKTRSGAVVQFIFRDDILRMINIDDDGDGYLDRLLLDTSGDGQFDREIVFTTKIPMIDWKKEALK